MILSWSVGLASAAILLFAFTFGQTRRPAPTAVFDNETVVSLLSLVITGLIAVTATGIGIDAEAALAEAAALPVATLAILLAAPLAALALAVLLMRPGLRRPETSGGVVIPMPPHGPKGRPPAQGGKTRRKRAA